MSNNIFQKYKYFFHVLKKRNHELDLTHIIFVGILTLKVFSIERLLTLRAFVVPIHVSHGQNSMVESNYSSTYMSRYILLHGMVIWVGHI